MSEYLSDEWLAGLIGPESPIAGPVGFEAVVNFEALKTPNGSYWVEYRDGQVISVERGTAKHAALTFSAALSDAESWAAGELRPDVAFMRGALKVDGEMSLVFELLAAWGAAQPSR